MVHIKVEKIFVCIFQFIYDDAAVKNMCRDMDVEKRGKLFFGMDTTITHSHRLR